MYMIYTLSHILYILCELGGPEGLFKSPRQVLEILALFAGPPQRDWYRRNAQKG